MKRWISWVLAFLLLVPAGGCGPRPGSRRAVEKLLDALVDGDLGEAEGCAKDGALSFDGRTRKAKSFFRAMFAALRYEIVDVEEEGGFAAVTLTVTAVNMELLAAAESFALLDGALSGEKRDGESFYETLTERIEGGAAEYTTSVVTVAVEESDEGWRVDLAASPAFAEAITGGLGELLA